jgi:hypothetical protein
LREIIFAHRAQFAYVNAELGAPAIDGEFRLSRCYSKIVRWFALSKENRMIDAMIEVPEAKIPILLAYLGTSDFLVLDTPYL